jgi:Ca2+-binding RTX toxin-like protein
MSCVTLLQTQSVRPRKLRKVNCTDTSFDSLIVRATAPAQETADGSATAGVAIPLRQPNSNVTQNVVRLWFYSIGADDTTYDVRINFWERVGDDPETAVWFAYASATLSATASTYVGLAGKDVLNTERFADTLTLTANSGNDDVTISIVSPANNTPAYIDIDFGGAELMEVTFDMTGATSANGLYRLY